MTDRWRTRAFYSLMTLGCLTYGTAVLSVIVR